MEIGLGTWRDIGGMQRLRKGIEFGGTFLHNAVTYRKQDVVGDIGKGIRERVFIATKATPGQLKTVVIKH